MIITDNDGRKTLVESFRIASMANPHQAAIKYNITPLNYSGQLSISSKLDGTIKNEGVNRYKDLKSKHLQPVDQGGKEDTSWLIVRTSQSNIKIAEAAKLRIISNDKIVTDKYGVTTDDGIVYTYIDQQAEINQTVTVEKLVTIYDSNNFKDEVKQKALDELSKNAIVR